MILQQIHRYIRAIVKISCKVRPRDMNVSNSNSDYVSKEKLSISNREYVFYSIKALEDQGNQKILVGSSHVPYSTKPATSGPHWAIRPDQNDLAKFGSPVKWGKYDEEIPDEALIHNLSHGGIGIHYDCPEGCPNLISKLDELRSKNSTQIVLSPYSGMNSKIALTSWRHVQYLEEYDEALINEFIKAYRDRAPESWIGNYWGDAIQ